MAHRMKGFAVVVAVSSVWAAASPCGAEPPSDAPAVESGAPETAQVQQELQHLRQLRQDDPEEFQRAVGERKAQLHQQLQQMKAQHPEQFQQFMGQVRQRRRERLEQLRTQDPARYQDVIARRQARMQERLERLKTQDPARYERVQQRLQERRTQTKDGQPQTDPARRTDQADHTEDAAGRGGSPRLPRGEDRGGRRHP